jgi:hypothetical protein
MVITLLIIMVPHTIHPITPLTGAKVLVSPDIASAGKTEKAGIN